MTQVKAETEALLKDVKKQRKEIGNEKKFQTGLRLTSTIALVVTLVLEIVSLFI
ncbi:MAG: hypothetical protein LUD47_00225 [Clostridia bacterium]|nr:hypothetical protein [Clostridia bacterium]